MSKNRIKSFIEGVGDSQATADKLTARIEEWLENNQNYEVVDVHTTSNKYAWMVTITYRKAY